MTLLNARLLEAAKTGDAPLVVRWLKKGADIQASDENGRTALHLAAEGNHLDVAIILVKQKADVNAPMCDEGTPIFDAVANGHDAMVNFLFDAGADSNVTDERDWNLMHWAASEGHFSTVELLIRRCPHLINKNKFNGVSPLYLVAANTDNVHMAKLLVRNGAHITQAVDDSDNPILAAKKAGHTNIADYLEGKIIYRQQRAHSKFFEYTRSKSAQTHRLADHYLYFRQQPDIDKDPIQASGVAARKLVMGDAGAVAKSVERLEDRASVQEIAYHAKWYNGGLVKTGKANASWSREYIHYLLDIDPAARGTPKKPEDVTISSQYKPGLGHLGNFFMAGVGSYGTGDKNILHVINETTRTKHASPAQKISNERNLARLMLNHARMGQPITTGILQVNNFAVYKTKRDRVTQLERLNRICYLTTVKEVSRRMHPGLRADGNEVEELPIGIAHIMALQLIVDGHLSMAEIFDAHAPYGLPTGTSLSTDREIVLAKEKLAALNRRFYKAYPKAGSSREDMHQLLLKGYGGDSDTSGEEYETSDEESATADHRGTRYGF